MSKDWLKDLSRMVMFCKFIPFETREKLSKGLLILPDKDVSRLIDLLMQLVLKENIKTLNEIAEHHEAAKLMRDLIADAVDAVKTQIDEGGKNNGSD